MEKYITLSQIDEAVKAVRTRIKHTPHIGIILGSGLNTLADSVQSAERIAYGEIPHVPVSTVVGHTGAFVVGEFESQLVIMMQGRIHFYEGYSMAQITLPVRIMQRLGVDTLIVSNAAGGIHPDFKPGDVMLITDHINLLGMTGSNPLIGQNFDELGPRFPDMSQPYDRDLGNLARRVAGQHGIQLHEGVYICLSGPSFESPADLRFLKAIGADAVGMSTVPEVIVARHGGMRVLGFSGISNKASLDGASVTTHEEVIEAGRLVTPKLETLIRGVLRGL
jgi:purine-nucleoside phosphorylase